MSQTEKEKMLAGELYDASDEELSQGRAEARKLVFQYNSSQPDEEEKKEYILNRLLNNIGGYINIEPPFNCDYGYNISVGDNFYANFGCVMLDVNTIIFGDNVLLGPNVQLYSATHPVDPDERLTFKELGLPISVGNNVWIGGGSIICPGVKIGNNTTIGAGSVVTKDIPDNAVAVGNPCRVIKSV